MDAQEINFSHIESLFLRQQKYQIAHLKQSTTSERISKLRKLERALCVYQEQFHLAMQQDFGKPAAEVDLTEIFTTLTEIKYAIKHLKSWMRPQYVKTPISMLGAHSRITFEPRGVVLIISPWNYPLQLVLCPLIGAIAAGNSVMLKYSPLTPHTNSLIKSMITENFAEDEIAVLAGDTVIMQNLLTLPFDHIFFTGSNTVGKLVMAAAAKNLTSVTLELGGKSPALIDETADLKDTAEKILWGKFINAGQTCIAPDFIWIHEKCRDAFIDHAKTVINRFTNSNIEQRSPDFCQIINNDHFNRLKKLYDDSLAQGAIVVAGGKFNTEDRYISLTLLANVTESMSIMNEEIFGPILPILTYSSLENDIYPKISRSPKPLSFYIFTRDTHRKHEIIKNSCAGGTVINNTLIHFTNPNLPFGGIGTSGMGNYHGFAGFKTFSHDRSVVDQGRFNLLKLFYPPYTASVKNWIKRAIRFFT